MRRVLMFFVLLTLSVAGMALPASSASAASWDTVDSDCHSDGVDGWSLYNWCWSKRKRLNDGTPNKDVYLFRMTSSGNSTNGKYLDKLWVEPEPRSTSPTQAWEGADPWKPDQTYSTSNDCKTWTWSIGASVEVVSAGYSVSGQVCQTESYGPKLYKSDPGHHAAVWNDSDCVAAGVVRKIAAAVLVRVGQGKLPLWSSDKRGANAYSSRSSC